jgi:hypothetical protein
MCGALHGAPTPAASYASGDLVRLARKETVMFKGEPFLAGPKGQEFTVLKHEPAKGVVYLAFVQKEGEVIAVTLPDAATVAPPLTVIVAESVQVFAALRLNPEVVVLTCPAVRAVMATLAADTCPLTVIAALLVPEETVLTPVSLTAEKLTAPVASTRVPEFTVIVSAETDRALVTAVLPLNVTESWPPLPVIVNETGIRSVMEPPPLTL